MAPEATGPEEPLDETEIGNDLRSRLADIEERLTEMKRPPPKGSAIGFGKRVGDGTTEAVSRFAEVGIANDLEVTASRIRRALEKLADGTYGACDDCGRPIARGRLRVSPASSKCVECARRSPEG